MIQEHEFEVIIVDWREIDNLGEFLSAVRKSKLNRECVLVAIMRDLLDLRQVFAAGVHFRIHKPASAMQIERCLRAAYCATAARRRKQHREPVHIVATVSTRMQPFTEAMVVNLSEGGIGLRIDGHDDMARVMLSAGEEVDLRFALPETGEILHTTGRVVLDDGSRWRHPLQFHSRRRATGARTVDDCVRGTFSGGALRAYAGGVPRSGVRRERAVARR